MATSYAKQFYTTLTDVIQRPKSDRLAPKVLALVAAGRSYRLIGRELGLSKNTVAEIVKRHRAAVPLD